MKISYEVRSTGKYDFHRFFIFFFFFIFFIFFFIIFFFMKKHNSITVAVLIFHANGFSSDLVHRHIVNLYSS